MMGTHEIKPLDQWVKSSYLHNQNGLDNTIKRNPKLTAKQGEDCPVVRELKRANP